jgi:citrate synthase
MSEIAEVKINGQTYELPIITGSEDEKGIDITKLRSLSGAVTLDSGYKNTGSTKSAVTYLDGENGILRYRGYSIEELAGKASFIEVSYLLINGELPNKSQLADFEANITKHTLIHEDMKRFYEAYPSKAHPMGIVASLLFLYRHSIQILRIQTERKKRLN